MHGVLLVVDACSPKVGTRCLCGPHSNVALIDPWPHRRSVGGRVATLDLLAVIRVVFLAVASHSYDLTANLTFAQETGREAGREIRDEKSNERQTDHSSSSNQPYHTSITPNHIRPNTTLVALLLYFFLPPFSLPQTRAPRPGRLRRCSPYFGSTAFNEQRTQHRPSECHVPLATHARDRLCAPFLVKRQSSTHNPYDTTYLQRSSFRCICCKCKTGENIHIFIIAAPGAPPSTSSGVPGAGRREKWQKVKKGERKDFRARRCWNSC